jgi:hypothetical protein
MNSLYPAIRVFLLGAALSGLAHAGPVTFNRGLPNSLNVNGSPALRSNEAWLTGFANGANYNIVGDDFSVAVGGTVNSITVFEVANNNVGDGSSATPTSEFASITLYEGPIASPLTAISSTYTFAQVFYQPGSVNFIDQNGFAFPIYALTFSGLNLTLTGGTIYGFALDSTPNPGGCNNSPFGDPCLLALHGSNAALSGTPQQGADGQFRNFTLSGGLATFTSFCNAACQASTAGVTSMAATDIDIQMVPEPATWGILAAGLAGLILFARKRRVNRVS